MRNRPVQTLIFALCLGLVAAQAACGARRSPGEADQTHACCTSDPSPAPVERCQACEAIVAVPKLAKMSGGIDAAPAVLSKTHVATAVLVTTRTRCVARALDLPPLLRDLHHLSTQLTE